MMTISTAVSSFSLARSYRKYLPFQGDYGSYGAYRPLSSTLDRLSTRSASAQQVNLANLRASTAISSTCHRGTTNPRPASVASSARSSLVSTQKPSLTSSSASQRASSVRRIRNLLDLESTRSIPTPTPTRTQGQILLDINPAGEPASLSVLLFCWIAIKGSLIVSLLPFPQSSSSIK